MSTLKSRHEKFAQLIASGATGAEAYRSVIGNGASAKNAHVHAVEWMRAKGVRERIEELKAEASAKCSLSREAYIKSLCEMYLAKPQEASMDNSRCDVVVVRGQKQAVFPPKLQVGQQLAKLVNWEGSIKVELRDAIEKTSHRFTATPRAPGQGTGDPPGVQGDPQSWSYLDSGEWARLSLLLGFHTLGPAGGTKLRGEPHTMSSSFCPPMRPRRGPASALPG